MATPTVHPRLAPRRRHLLLYAAAIAPLDHIGWLRVTGPDRLRWLNGMLTNSIAQLVPGEGCYNFVLNAQGRIRPISRLPARRCHPAGNQPRPARESPRPSQPLHHHGRRRAGRHHRQRCGLRLAGPDASRLARRIGLSSEPLLRSMTHFTGASRRRSPLAYSPLVPQFEIWTDSSTFDLRP